MITRMWRGRAPAGVAHRYEEHFSRSVASRLRDIDGFRGAYLLRRELDGDVEFLAVTLWESRAHVHAFAGEDIDTAVVDPAARAVLSSFDDFVTHYDVVFADGEERP